MHRSDFDENLIYDNLKQIRVINFIAGNFYPHKLKNNRGELMKTLKNLGLVAAAFAFCMTLLVSTSYAQPGRARYEGNNGKHKGWSKQKNRRAERREDRFENRDDRYERRNDRLGVRNQRAYNRGRLSQAEYRRLEQRRERLDDRQDRYEDSGRGINNKERRKLNKQYSKYRRTVRRARNN